MEFREKNGCFEKEPVHQGELIIKDCVVDLRGISDGTGCFILSEINSSDIVSQIVKLIVFIYHLNSNF